MHTRLWLALAGLLICVGLAVPAFATDPPPAGAFVTSPGSSGAFSVVQNGLEADGQTAVPCGSSLVAYGCGIPSGSSSATTLAYAGSSNATVGTTSGTVIAAGAYKHILIVFTLPGSTGNVWLNPTGGPAVVGSGILIAKAGGYFVFGPVVPIPTSAITAITDGGSSQPLSFAGG